MPLVLLYDGVCGFCDRSVQLVLNHDRRKTMLFAPLQSAYARAVLARHPELKGADSLVLVDDSDPAAERVFIRSEAALRIARYLGGSWKLLLAGRIVPRPVRDAVYDVLARNRRRIFGTLDRCRIPPDEVRSRFIDLV